MELLLLRHADAEPNARTDQERPLTSKGQQQAETASQFCDRHELSPTVILTSPYRRTVQTARAIAAALGGVTVHEEAFLASGMSPATALRELQAYASFSSVMLVGHQPDLGLLAASLLGLADAENLPVGKAALISIVTEKLTPASGNLQFFVPVKLMGE